MRNIEKKLTAPRISRVNVEAKVKISRRFIFFHESNSKSCPAINRVPKPKSIKREIIKRLMVASPSAPI